MRMHGIDAPEMPGACRPGRRCTPGNPFAARDHLRSLTQGRVVRCEEKDVDRYGRVVVRCVADDIDLGCAMIEAGHAVERYGRLNCDRGVQVAAVDPVPVVAARSETPRPARKPDAPKRYFAPPDAEPGSPLPSWALPAALLLFAFANLLGFALMAHDLGIARSPPVEQRRRRRLSNATLTLVAAAGGGGGMLAVQTMHGHKLEEANFSRNLLLLTGLWIGVLAGAVLLQVG